MIPHFVGGKNLPTFPITEKYVKFILLVYKPWYGSFDENQNFILAYNFFIVSPECSLKAKIIYWQLRKQFSEKSQFSEPTSSVENIHSKDTSIPSENVDLVDIASTLHVPESFINAENIYNFDYCKNYDWSKCSNLSSNLQEKGSDW